MPCFHKNDTWQQGCGYLSIGLVNAGRGFPGSRKKVVGSDLIVK